VDYKISRFQRFIGSDFDYTRSTLSASYYHSMTDSLDVLAFNLVLQNAFGQVPFFDYAYFGSPKVLRGFNDRRFTDENMVAIQAEWRKQLWRRFGSVLFAGAGTVAGQPFGLLSNTLRTAAGVGIRYLINKEDRVFLRLDYGLTTEGGNFYLTVNQAF
jgi:outer membrane protein assembly factor BamA